LFSKLSKKLITATRFLILIKILIKISKNIDLFLFFYIAILLLEGGKMLNQTVLVGRLVKEPEVIELENGKKVTNIVMAINRSFKDSNGEYQTDFIRCVLWDAIAVNTAEYVKVGDLLGIKGRLQTRTYEVEDDTKYVMEVIAEKVTFLSSRKEVEE
jgi:single-strand DNA-binding protein